jgi:hypothetical protein
MYKLILCLALIYPSIFSHAAVDYQTSDIKTAVKINDFKIPAASFDLLYQIAHRHDQNTAKPALIRSLIEHYLFAREAEKEFDAETLFPKSSIGFDRSVTIDRDFVRTLFQRYPTEIHESIKKLPKATLNSLLVKPIYIDKKILSNITHLENSLTYNLTGMKIEHAKNLILTTYRLPDSKETTTISLWDIYKRQNLQGRFANQNGNIPFLTELVRDYLMERYAFYWAEHKSSLTKNDIDALLHLFSDRLIKQQYLTLKGLNIDAHHTNHQQTKQSKKITQSEINEYYKANKKDFQIIEKVNASHIRLDSQELADDVYKKLMSGFDFKKAVQLYSTSSKSNDGKLGWIKNKDKHSSWLKGIAFIQQEGIVSKPFRSPQTPQADIFWEIILVHKKVIGYQAMDSEGVRYEASRHIAQQNIIDAFNAKRSELIKNNKITLNKEVFGQHVY